MRIRSFWKSFFGQPVFLLVLAFVTMFPAVPIAAHAPEGAGEVQEADIAPIQIYNGEGTLLEISLDDAIAVHGDLCPCVAGAYRVVQAAINVLYGEDELPSQGNLTVLYHHPGTGHKQVLAYILTPDCVVYEKTGNPQHMTADHWVYEFTRLDTGEIFETQIKEGVIADDFFDLRYTVDGFDKGWHENQPSGEERSGYAEAYTETLNNLLTLPGWELYNGIEEPEEPAPVAAIVFSGALIVLIALGFISSARKKRR